MPRFAPSFWRSRISGMDRYRAAKRVTAPMALRRPAENPLLFVWQQTDASAHATAIFVGL
jgi:hypothetical protein